MGYIDIISKKAGGSETDLHHVLEEAETNTEDYDGAIVIICELGSIVSEREKPGRKSNNVLFLLNF